MMNKFAVLCLALLLGCLLQSTSANTTEDDIASWTWSEKIEEGYYSWNVSEFSYQSQRVTEKTNDQDLIEGSIIKLHVKSPLNGIEFYNFDENFSLPIDIYFDENIVAQNRLYPVEFIYPNLIGWQNGTYENLFLLDNGEFDDILNFSNDTRMANGDYFIEQISDQHYYQSIREIDTGILKSWILEYSTSALKYSYIGYENIESIDKTVEMASTAFGISVIAIVLAYNRKLGD